MDMARRGRANCHGKEGERCGRKAIQCAIRPNRSKLRLREVRTGLIGAKPNAVTGKKLEASIRADVDEVQGEPDWTHAIMGIPAPQDHINIRVDHDVLEWFRANGRGTRPS